MPMHYKRERNREIYEAYRSGENVTALSRRFGLCRSRIQRLIAVHYAKLTDEEKEEFRRQDEERKRTAAEMKAHEARHRWATKHGTSIEHKYKVMYTDPRKRCKDTVVGSFGTRDEADKAVRELNAAAIKKYGFPEPGRPVPLYYTQGVTCTDLSSTLGSERDDAE